MSIRRYFIHGDQGFAINGCLVVTPLAGGEVRDINVEGTEFIRLFLVALPLGPCQKAVPLAAGLWLVDGDIEGARPTVIEAFHRPEPELPAEPAPASEPPELTGFEEDIPN